MIQVGTNLTGFKKSVILHARSAFIIASLGK
jgi:hypothetical protein